MRSIRLNLAADEVSIADQINVTEYRKDIEGYNAGLTKVGAIADFIRTASSAVAFYAMNATPGGASGGASAGSSGGGGAGANYATG